MFLGSVSAAWISGGGGKRDDLSLNSTSQSQHIRQRVCRGGLGPEKSSSHLVLVSGEREE